MPPRGPGFLLKGGRPFSPFRPLLQPQMRQGEEEMRGGEVKSLCYLFGGMLCLGPRVLKELVNSRIRRLGLV